MVTKGLLVQDRDGQEYLLATESFPDWERQRLSICRRVNGQWIPVASGQSHSIRAALMAALLDFFGGLCRILHHTDVADAALGNGMPRRPVVLKQVTPVE